MQTFFFFFADFFLFISSLQLLLLFVGSWSLRSWNKLQFDPVVSLQTTNQCWFCAAVKTRWTKFRTWLAKSISNLARELCTDEHISQMANSAGWWSTNGGVKNEFVLRNRNNRAKGKKKEAMHEEISWKEDLEQRWGAKDQDVALKLQELSVDTAGGQWRENHDREYHTVTNHIANSQLSLIRQPSATQPLHTLRFLLPHDTSKTILCEKLLCCQEQVTAVPVWDHEVRAVTGNGRRGLVAQ